MCCSVASWRDLELLVLQSLTYFGKLCCHWNSSFVVCFCYLLWAPRIPWSISRSHPWTQKPLLVFVSCFVEQYQLECFSVELKRSLPNYLELSYLQGWLNGTVELGSCYDQSALPSRDKLLCYVMKQPVVLRVSVLSELCSFECSCSFGQTDSRARSDSHSNSVELLLLIVVSVQDELSFLLVYWSHPLF